MPVNLTIKAAPDDIVNRLKARANCNHRSLQSELLAILEEALRREGDLTVDEVRREVSRLGLETRADSAGFVRADRDVR